MFGSADAAWFLLGQAGNEGVVHALKEVFKVVAGKHHTIVRRPPGAADSGIYPQHFPTASTSSGMPSGHSQMSAFAAAVLSHEVWVDAGCEHRGDQGYVCDVRPFSAAIASVCFLWLVAICVMTSRTKHGGPFSVKLYGKVIAQHTCLQVIVGAAFGGCLGEAAAEWHRSRPVHLWLGTALIVFLLTVLAVKLDSGKTSRTSEELTPWGLHGRGDDDLISTGSVSASVSSASRAGAGERVRLGTVDGTSARIHSSSDMSRHVSTASEVQFQTVDTGIELQSMVILPDSFEPGRGEATGPDKI